ncbi:MAG: hypothetical protein GF307_04270, partial [candidate division Zixibacteria bacterium]|nr:hypothetical protein [candidate division Zixibacteria bacterium]
ETCINCKNCRIVCPANCDASTDSRYYKEEHRRFALEPMFIAMNNPGLMRKGAAMAAMGMPLFNNNRPLRKLIENLSKPALKLDKDATLPKPSTNPFAVRFNKRLTGNARVAYFYGCADGFLENQTAEKIVRVFDMMGTSLDIPEQVCCGVPAESYGFTEYSRQAAGYNIESLNRYDYIITGCGTCVLMLKDYPHLFKSSEHLYKEAKKLAAKVHEVSEFLLKYGDNLNSAEKGKITYHDSCHLRCAGTESEPRQFIKELGLNYVEMDYADRCCGFAGTHYFTDPHESSRIFDIKRKSLDESGAEIVASCCPTCILQFAIQQTNARSVHPVSLIEINGKRG